MNKNKIRLRAFAFLGSFSPKIRKKLNNICGKTGLYDVPAELYQKRTSRKNRVLLPWKNVKNNGLTLEQLESFSGGVVVEFVNEDYFLPENRSDPVFMSLVEKIGSNDTVSAIISIRSESGSPSSAQQRSCFTMLLNNTLVRYKGDDVYLNEENYMQYAVRRIARGGMGNDKWDGFLFVSIRGGQQDIIETHAGRESLLFNPACEYASSKVCVDLDLVMAYYAMLSIDTGLLSPERLAEYNGLMPDITEALRGSEYDSDAYRGNLLDYCNSHPSVKMISGKLTDPIQVEEIHIEDFAINGKEDPRSLDFTHDEAVNKGRFYWDRAQNCVLSPARPTNVFWSKHLSNMMQQNFSLSEYFEHEREIIRRRESLLE